MNKKRRVLLVDGHSLAYRAYFALPDTLTTASGQPTNAVYGFLSMLLKVLADERPDAVIVALDGPRRELQRTAVFPEYKANRPPTPEEFISQMEIVRDLLGKLRIPAIQVPGHEADDVLGTLAKKIKASGGEAEIVTGDRDALQLVDIGVTVLMTGKGITEVTYYDRDRVVGKYGIEPEEIPDYIGLKGDSSDNIPGVPGIGEKGASSLIGEYGSLENLYDNLDCITGKRKSALEENREKAFLSRELATIESDLDLELDIDALKLGDWDIPDVTDYLEALEFKTLSKRFKEMFGGEAGGGRSSRKGIDLRVVDSSKSKDVDSFIANVKSSGAIAVTAVVEGGSYCEIEMRGFAMADSESVLIVKEDEFEGSDSMKAAVQILESRDIEKWSHGAKAIMHALDKLNISLSNLSFDTEIAAYLENPSLGNYEIRDLWEKNVGDRILINGNEVHEGDQGALLFPGEEELGETLAVQAIRIHGLKPVLELKLSELGMGELFKDLEMPLVEVLAGVEKNGVALDLEYLAGMSEEAGRKISRLEAEIFEIAGHEFNVGSTKQLALVLFEEMGIPPVKKTKTGYSTDSSVLELLKDDYDIAGKVLDYRFYSKLKSTYLDALPELVCARTGKVHCQLNQTVTATGRISSSNPNLQNIPVRTDFGHDIRTAFIPGSKGWKMLVADYSQIELRVLAHMSGDPILIEAFKRGADIHNETAAMVFGADPDNVTPQQRRVAKMINYGVAYGMSYYGLASRLGITNEEAALFINAYFERFSVAKEYIDGCIERAKKLGYAETMMGRRRIIPEISSSNRQVKEFGERVAVNTPLQGTAADIIKKTMVDIYQEIRVRGMKSRMTLQIHDELVFDVEPEEGGIVEELVAGKMMGVLELKVPLDVNIGIYGNWGEAK